MAFTAGIVRKLDDWVNPIAVKEMRQAVNGRFIEWTLIGFLGIQVIISASILLYGETYEQNFNTGRNVFIGQLGVLLAACLFYVPISTAVRFSSERSEHNIDLVFVTTLKPIQIVFGKTLAAMLLMFLFFSASMPFMTLTYLLRGVDIPSIFILLAIDSLVVIVSVQLGILLACIPSSTISRGFCFPLGLAFLIFIFLVAIQSSNSFLLRGFGVGFGAGMGSWRFWGPALNLTAFAAIVTGLMFILSVTLVTPRSANRALGIRVYLLIVWFIYGAIAGVWSFVVGNDGLVREWLIDMVIMFSVALFVSVGERQELGPRVLRTIPKKKILRLPAFLLYSGAASGAAFSTLMLTGSILLTYSFIKIAPLLDASMKSADDKRLMTAIVFAFYSMGYALTAMTIRRTVFGRSQRPNIALEVALVVVAAGSAIPTAIGYLLNSGPRDIIESHWYLGNPIAIFWERDALLKYLPYTGLWAIVAVAVTVPWLIRRFRSFKPPEAET